jgi:hypothetical protein
VICFICTVRTCLAKLSQTATCCDIKESCWDGAASLPCSRQPASSSTAAILLQEGEINDPIETLETFEEIVAALQLRFGLRWLARVKLIIAARDAAAADAAANAEAQRADARKPGHLSLP